MPPVANRIEYRNAGGELVAEVTCSADGVTGTVYQGTAQMGAFQLGVSGHFALSTGGGELVVQPDGIAYTVGPEFQFGDQIRAQNLPTSDPADYGRLWNDAGTVKVSAG